MQTGNQPTSSSSGATSAWAILLAFVLTGGAAAMELTTPANWHWPIVYFIPLALMGWTRRRTVVWASAGALMALSLVGLFLGQAPEEGVPAHSVWLNRFLVAASLAVMALVIDQWVLVRLRAETDRAELETVFDQAAGERSRLQAVLRAVPFGILICEAECREVRTNPAGAALLNVPADTPISPREAFSHITALREGRALEVEEHPLLIAARTGREVTGEELEWLVPGGRRVHVLISAVPIRDRDGKVAGAVSVKADVTALKTLQRELDLRRREAEEANVRKSRFLAAASHDIRTPANAISLLAELIKRSAENPAMVGDIRELADELHKSALSLVELVSNVLDVTRFDADKLELRESEFALGPLLEEEARQVMPLAEAKGLRVNVERPERPLWLRTDRIKLGRIVGNLLSNAIKFTERGGVTVSARAREGFLQVAVSDTGIGIAPEHQKRVFDEFYQAGDAHRAKGSGLGLAICKRLAEAMGGAVTVKSVPGEGATFTVVLPSSALARTEGGLP